MLITRLELVPEVSQVTRHRNVVRSLSRFRGGSCRSVRRGCWNGNGEVTQYAGSRAIRRLIRLAISFGLFDRQQFDNKVQICMWWHGGW